MLRHVSKQGRWKEAVAAYEESLRLDPNNPQTYLNLGFVYYELGYAHALGKDLRGKISLVLYISKQSFYIGTGQRD